MNGSAGKALLAAAGTVLVVAVLRSWGVTLWLLIAAVGVGLGVLLLGYYGHQLLDAFADLQRRLRWRDEEGSFVAFAGVRLRVDDDGLHTWIAGADLQRVLGTRDAQDVLAARHAGQWRLDDQAALWLRADSVVQRLNTMPGRADPRVQRLRRFIERDIIYPAGQRRRRA